MPTICYPNCNKSDEVHKEENCVDQLQCILAEVNIDVVLSRKFIIEYLLFSWGVCFAFPRLLGVFVLGFSSEVLLLMLYFSANPILMSAMLYVAARISHHVYETLKTTQSSACSDVELFCKTMSLAKKGNFYAKNHVGICYILGKGTSPDYYEAFKWFKKTDYYGLCNRGWCYYNGRGVTTNYSRAVLYFYFSSSLPEAQYNLGVCFYNGNGVKQNRKKAIKWFRRAAKQGCAEARDALKIIEVL